MKTNPFLKFQGPFKKRDNIFVHKEGYLFTPRMTPVVDSPMACHSS